MSDLLFKNGSRIDDFIEYRGDSSSAEKISVFQEIPLQKKKIGHPELEFSLNSLHASELEDFENFCIGDDIDEVTSVNQVVLRFKE